MHVLRVSIKRQVAAQNVNPCTPDFMYFTSLLLAALNQPVCNPCCCDPIPTRSLIVGINISSCVSLYSPAKGGKYAE